MFCACTLAIAMLMMGAPRSSLSLPQDTGQKSSPQAANSPHSQPPSQSETTPQSQNSSPPPQNSSPPQTPAPAQPDNSPQKQPAPQAQPQTPPQPALSETPSADQAQPPAQGAPEKPNEIQPEQKKSPFCTTQNGSGNIRCGKRGTNGRRVVRHGSTGEPTAQLVPGMTAEQALRHRQATEQLLSSAEGNLQQLTRRSLDQNQQATVSQIRNYMLGARSALDSGDLTRARNLAFKAHLLADDLLKH